MIITNWFYSPYKLYWRASGTPFLLTFLYINAVLPMHKVVCAILVFNASLHYILSVFFTMLKMRQALRSAITRFSALICHPIQVMTRRESYNDVCQVKARSPRVIFAAKINFVCKTIILFCDTFKKNFFRKIFFFFYITLPLMFRKWCQSICCHDDFDLLREHDGIAFFALKKMYLLLQRLNKDDQKFTIWHLTRY